MSDKSSGMELDANRKSDINLNTKRIPCIYEDSTDVMHDDDNWIRNKRTLQHSQQEDFQQQCSTNYTDCALPLQNRFDVIRQKDNWQPWVDTAKHLGITIDSKSVSIPSQDMKQKRAQYIQRNNELLQEFSFANGFTKSKINSIYNTHFTGSVLWDLFGDDACKIYSTWNTSVRKILH